MRHLRQVTPFGHNPVPVTFRRAFVTGPGGKIDETKFRRVPGSRGVLLVAAPARAQAGGTASSPKIPMITDERESTAACASCSDRMKVPTTQAGVVKLADARDSKSRIRKGVWVRLPTSGTSTSAVSAGQADVPQATRHRQGKPECQPHKRRNATSMMGQPDDSADPSVTRQRSKGQRPALMARPACVSVPLT